MKTLKRYSMAALVLFSALVIFIPQAAYAVGTTSGTVISNMALVDYQVGGIDQTQIESAPGAGNSTPGVGQGTNTTFTVDKMVDLTVAAGAGGVVFANQTSAPLVFTVSNTGNAPMYFDLSAVEVTDARPMLTIQPELWHDVDASGTVTGGDVQYFDETTFGLFSGDVSFQVLVTGDISAAAENGDTATVNLFANAYTALGVEAVDTASTGAGDGIVLADDDADGGALDDANNGADFATNTYTVSGTTMLITKTAAVYSDPVNGTGAGRMAIPGAIITYTITVANTGGVDATSVKVIDLLDVANVTFVTAFQKAVPCGADEGFFINTVCTDSLVAPEDYNVTTGDTVTISGLTVAAGNTTTIQFQVTIN